MSQSAETQIETFLAKYAPEIATQLRQARGALQALFPHGHELVYDNYNALVFGFSPTERASEAIVSIAGYPKWITLFFQKGAALKDPDRLLQGQGSQVRSIRLSSPEELENPTVLSLIQQAVEPCRSSFATAPKLRTVVRSVSEKQRPRRPSAPAAASSPNRPGSKARR